jgi:hypothetical protein
MSAAAWHRRPAAASPDAAGGRRPVGPTRAAVAVDGDADAAADAASSDAVGLAAQTAFQDALLRLAASGAGEQAILAALRAHTGLPALTEDCYGNVRAQAGTLARSPSPVGREPARARLLDAARRVPGAVRAWGRLVAPIEMAGELLGVVALLDPEHAAVEGDRRAVERTGLALAPLLAHERRLAELRPRLRLDLVEKLISGEAPDDAPLLAATFGHDLRLPRRAAVLRWPDPADQAALGEAVARAAARLRWDALLGGRADTAVALVAGAGDRDAGLLYQTVVEELGAAAGAVGFGCRCECPDQLPHSYDQAVRALTARQRSRRPHGGTAYGELGLCRVLGGGHAERETGRFVREWLGDLLDYDARHHANLVATLARYLESGGSYDAAAESLRIHRSTLRYRLQRIREITGHDLGEVETRLNLHVATRIRDVLGEGG